MKKIFSLVFFAFLLSFFANAQAIVKGSGVVYTNGAPTHSVNFNQDAEMAIDTTSGYWYERSRDGLGWLAAGFRVQLFPFSVAPTAAPLDKQSEVLLNNVDSLYRWRGGAWRHINPAGDPSVTNEGILGVGVGSGTSATLLSNTSGANPVTINASTGLSISETANANGGQFTLTNSAPDQTVVLTGAGITSVTGTYPNFTITSTEVDGSITNEGLLGVGAGSGTSAILLTNSSTGVGVTVNVSGIITISETASANGGQITLAATEVDGSITNELQTLANASTSTTHTTTLSNSGGSTQFVEGTGIGLATTGTGLDGILTITNTAPDQTVAITGAGISVVTGTYPNFTVTSTEIDGSITNELQTISSTSDATSHTATLSNSGGSIQFVEGSNITLTTSGTGLNAVVTIASSGGGAGTDLGYTGTTSPVTLTSSTGTDVTITEGGIVTVTASGSNMTISATEVDGSVTNEAWTIGADAGGTELISNQTVTFEGDGIISTTYNAGLNSLVITGTEVDGNVSNEGSLTVGAGGVNSSTIVSNTSGSTAVTIEGGANVTVTESGGIITIAATSGGGTDLTFTGASSPFTLNSSTGTDVTFAQGDGISLSRSVNELTVTNSAPDQVVALTGAGVNVVTGTYPNFTITGTEVDGNISNEGSLTVGAGSGTTSIINSNTSGSTGVTVTAGTGLSISEAGNVITLTNASPDQTVSITGAGINVVTGTYPNFTVTGTEVDGSITNELQTLANSSTSTTHTTTLSNTGGSTQFVEGTGIGLGTTGTGLDGVLTITNTSPDQTVVLTGAGITSITGSYPSFTITSTEVDGSISNEGTLGIGSGSGTSSTLLSTTSGANAVTINVSTGLSIAESTSANGGSITLTNSAPDQTVSITGAGISVVTGTYPNFTVTSTEVDGSITNEGLLGVGAGSGTSAVLLTNSSTGVGVTINAAGILAISETASGNGGQITLTATEVDGSVSNELQTIANSSDATSHTAILSNAGGSVKLVEGANITLTTSGTGLDGIVTIASTGGSTDLTFTGAGPVYTLNSSTGTDVTITQGTGATIVRSGNDLTFSSNSLYVGDGVVPANTQATYGGQPFELAFEALFDEAATNSGVGFQSNDGAGDRAYNGIINNTAIGLQVPYILSRTDLEESHLFFNGGDVNFLTDDYLHTIAGDVNFDIQSTSNTVKITDGRVVKVGMEYAGDYGPSLIANPRSLPDVEAVKDIYTAGTNITLTPVGNNIQISATGSADGNGFYSGNGGNGGNGTIPSVTESVITNQFTFKKNTAITGAFVPVRIELAGASDAKIMSFKDNSAGDSLTVGHEDVGFNFISSTSLGIGAATKLFLSADSINIDIVPNAFENEATILMLSPAGTIVKSEGLDPDIIKQNGALDGDVLTWDTPTNNWVPQAAGGGGGGAPVGAQYLVLAADATLTNERVATAGENVKTTDAGAGLAYTFDVGTEKFTLKGDISPASFAVGQDDYNPAGLATISTLRLEPTANVDLTGLQGGSDGRVIIIQNVGTGVLGIPDEDVLSAAGNRWDVGEKIYIRPTLGGIFQYDGTSSRWRCIGNATYAQGSVTYEYVTSQSNTTIDILPGTKIVEFLGVGAGGGGGSGRKGLAGTVRSGGAGGGGGGVTQHKISITELGNPTQLQVDVGAGGAGGDAQAGNSANGNAGAVGGNTQLETTGGVVISKASGGGGGGNGSAAAAAGGGGGSRAMFVGGAGSGSSNTGLVGVASPAIFIITPTGGGSAGGITTANVQSAGGASGVAYFGIVTGAVAGTAGGGAGNNGSAPVSGQLVGSGGSGGGSNNTGNGGNGGNGARGGGGGGGGASVNDTGSSGKGGDGGVGYARVTLYF